MRVFLDTSYYIALLNKQDQWHRTAVRAFKADDQLFTSSFIVNETISLMQARGHFSAAVEFLRNIRSNDSLQILQIDPATQAEAWDVFAKWGASGANAVDCASFAVMRRLGIRKALTFDQHFKAAGFTTL